MSLVHWSTAMSLYMSPLTIWIHASLRIRAKNRKKTAKRQNISLFLSLMPGAANLLPP